MCITNIMYANEKWFENDMFSGSFFIGESYTLIGENMNAFLGTHVSIHLLFGKYQYLLG